MVSGVPLYPSKLRLIIIAHYDQFCRSRYVFIDILVWIENRKKNYSLSKIEKLSSRQSRISQSSDLAGIEFPSINVKFINRSKIRNSS